MPSASPALAFEIAGFAELRGIPARPEVGSRTAWMLGLRPNHKEEPTGPTACSSGGRLGFLTNQADEELGVLTIDA